MQPDFWLEPCLTSGHVDDLVQHFRNDVLAKRPYLTEAMCRAIIQTPARREIQSDGRVRHWGFAPEIGKWLRVVTLEDGETLHNAFPDRGFKP